MLRERFLQALCVLLLLTFPIGANGQASNLGNTKIRIQILDGERKPLASAAGVYIEVFSNSDFNDRLYANTEELNAKPIEIALNLQRPEILLVAARVTGLKTADSPLFLANPGELSETRVLLVSKNARPKFNSSTLDGLKVLKPEMWRVFSEGQTPGRAAEWYRTLSISNPNALAAYFTIAESLSYYHLDGQNLFSYYKQIDWSQEVNPKPKYGFFSTHHGLDQDRFFAWVNIKLLSEIRRHLNDPHPDFRKEPCPKLWGHHGSTFSVKLVTFNRGNFQLSFDENGQKVIDGETYIRVDTDIDYFPTLFKHVFLEVFPHVFGGLTQPRKVYAMEWRELEARNQPFEPPYGWMASGK